MLLFSGANTCTSKTEISDCQTWSKGSFSTLVANPCFAWNSGGTEISWFWTKCTCESWLLTPLPPPGSTEVIAFSRESESWVLILSVSILSTLTVNPLYTVHGLLILSTLTVNPLYIDCWPSLHCTLTVDPLYTVHWLLILSTLTVDPLYIDCWPSLHCTLTVDPLYTVHWLLILCTLTVNPLYIDCWPSLHCWPSAHWLLILSTFTVDLPPPGSTVLIVDPPWVNTVDCWSTPGWHCQLTPPRINCVDHWSAPGQHCWSLIHPGLTLLIDPPQDQQSWSLICPGWTLLIVDLPRVDTADRPPRTDFNFVIFNILMNKLCFYDWFCPTLHNCTRSILIPVWTCTDYKLIH